MWRTAAQMVKIKNRRHALRLREWQKAARVGRLWPSAEHTERGTVLQTAPRSVQNVKFHHHKIKLQVWWMQRERRLKLITPVHVALLIRMWSRAIQPISDMYLQIQDWEFAFDGRTKIYSWWGHTKVDVLVINRSSLFLSQSVHTILVKEKICYALF